MGRGALTGLLLVPIVLHALWDFSVLARGETGSEISLSVSSASSSTVKLGSIMTLLPYLLLLLSAIVMWRRDRVQNPPWASEQAPCSGSPVLDPSAVAGGLRYRVLLTHRSEGGGHE